MKTIPSVSSTLLVCLLSLSSAPSFSQIPKGAFSLGGSLSGTFYEGSAATSPNSRRRIDLSPNAGYMSGEKTMLGIGLGFSYETDTWNLTYLNQASDMYIYSVQLFWRRYWYKNDHLGFYLQGTLSPGMKHEVRNTTYYSSSTQPPTVFIDDFQGSAAIQPGLYYRVSPRIAVEAQYGMLSYALVSGQTHAPLHSAGLNLNSTFAFGLRYFFVK